MGTPFEIDRFLLGALSIGGGEVELLLNDGRSIKLMPADLPMVRAAEQCLRGNVATAAACRAEADTYAQARERRERREAAEVAGLLTRACPCCGVIPASGSAQPGVLALLRRAGWYAAAQIRQALRALRMRLQHAFAGRAEER